MEQKAALTEFDLTEECQVLQRYLLNLGQVKVRRLEPQELHDSRHTPELLHQLEKLYRKTLR